MALCVRTPREATRVHATRAGQAKIASKVYIQQNLVQTHFLFSMSEKPFWTGLEIINFLRNVICFKKLSNISEIS